MKPIYCQSVCELTGATNGYEHVSVSGERLSIHENRKAEKEIRKVNIVANVLGGLFLARTHYKVN